MSDLRDTTSGEPVVLGEVPKIAAGLLTCAEPDTIMICSTTRRLIGGLFQYREYEPMLLPGRAEPVTAWEVIGEGSAEGRFEALRGSTRTPLVGREEEIELLLLGRAASFARDDPLAARLEKLEALLAQAEPPKEDIALLVDLLSLPGSERHPLPNLGPQRKRTGRSKR